MIAMWMALLYFSGLVLILAEAILPGGICGAVGFVFVCLSAGIGIYYYEGQYIFLIVVLEALGAFATVALSMVLLTKTRAARFLMLETQQRPEDGYTNMPDDHTLLGESGTVLTALRPAGTIEVDGRRLDAVAQGAFIEKGAAVRVVEVHGNRIVVERADS